MAFQLKIKLPMSVLLLKHTTVLFNKKQGFFIAPFDINPSNKMSRNGKVGTQHLHITILFLQRHETCLYTRLDTYGLWNKNEISLNFLREIILAGPGLPSQLPRSGFSLSFIRSFIHSSGCDKTLTLFSIFFF